MKASYKLMLKGAVIGSVAFVMAASGCSSDANNTAATGGSAGTAGKGSTAGSTSQAGNGAGGDTTTAGTAGKTGTAGSSNPAGGATGTAGGNEGGASGGEGGFSTNGGRPTIGFPSGGAGADAGGAGGAGTGPADAKFCNTLSFGQAQTATTMILKVGEGADMVTFTAKTGTCAPADGKMCTKIPVGPTVLVEMFDADAPDTALDSATGDFSDGNEYILYSDLDASSQPIWAGLVLPNSAQCKDVIYSDIIQNP